MNEPMSIEIAHKIVSHREANKKQTWKETVAEVVPWMNCDSVRSYISKFNRGEVRVRQDSVYIPPTQLDYTIIHKAWL